MDHYKVSLVITIVAESEEDAVGVAQGAAEHLLQTFNDDYSIARVTVIKGEQS